MKCLLCSSLINRHLMNYLKIIFDFNISQVVYNNNYAGVNFPGNNVRIKIIGMIKLTST